MATKPKPKRNNLRTVAQRKKFLERSKGDTADKIITRLVAADVPVEIRGGGVVTTAWSERYQVKLGYSVEGGWVIEYGKSLRGTLMEALRDWVENGDDK